MNAFLTGSHAYGTPREDSDIDLVVFIEPAHMAHVIYLTGANESDDPLGDYGITTRFGKLNLIIVDSETAYNVWREGTNELIARAPVTRDEAIEVFDRLRAAAREKK